MKQVVAIFGAPRSGTTWLGQIFNSSPHAAYRFQPLFSYRFKGRLRPDSTNVEIVQFYDDLLLTKDDFVLQTKNISGNKGLYFDKAEITHLVWKEVRYHFVIEQLIRKSSIKIIGIVRHPCAVINSWLNAPKEFDTSWNPLDEWRFAQRKNMGLMEEYNGFEKWKELAFLYLRLSKEYPHQFKIVVYERLNDQPHEMVRKLFDFVGLRIGDQTTEFIDASRSTESADPYGVFRVGKRNESWRVQLQPVIQDAILHDEHFSFFNERFGWSI